MEGFSIQGLGFAGHVMACRIDYASNGAPSEKHAVEETLFRIQGRGLGLEFMVYGLGVGLRHSAGNRTNPKL